MSAINVNSITGRTGLHGPVLTGVSTAADGFQVLAGEFKVNGISTFVGMSTFNGGIDVASSGPFKVSGVSTFVGVSTFNGGLDVGAPAGTSPYNPGVAIDQSGFLVIRRSGGFKGLFVGPSGSSNYNIRLGTQGEANFMGNVGIGTDDTGAGLLSVHKGTSGSNYINITNSVTGPAAWSNGMLLGNNAAGDALVWQNEYLNMRFGTNNTDRMTLTEDGDLGIGITDPGAQLHVVDSSATTTDCLKLRNYASGSVNSQPSITFEAVTSGGQGANSHIRGIAGTEAGGLSNQNASGIQFDVRYGGGGTLREAAKFTTDGNLKFPSGQGIDFSATGNGSGTMSSELLDDYEEGTWTPSLSVGGSESGVVYSQQVGSYTRIGRFVTCYGSLILTNKGSGSGGIAINGLPFTVVDIISGTSLEGGGLMTYQANISGVYGPITVLPTQLSTSCTMYYATSSAGGMGGLSDGNISNTLDTRFMFTYQTNT